MTYEVRWYASFTGLYNVDHADVHIEEREVQGRHHYVACTRYNPQARKFMYRDLICVLRFNGPYTQEERIEVARGVLMLLLLRREHLS